MKKVVDITSLFKEGINDNDLISSLEQLRAKLENQ